MSNQNFSDSFQQELEAKNQALQDANPYLPSGRCEIPFPYHVFPDELQEMIGLYSKQRDYSQVALAFGILNAFSVALGLNYESRLFNGWTSTGLLYSVLVGNSSEGKTPAMLFTLKPLQELEAEFREKHKEELKAYNNSYNQASQNNEDFEEKPPILREVILNDATMEALMDTHKNNPKGLLMFRDELVSWVNSMNNYRNGKGADQQNWLSIWANAPFKTTRKGVTSALDKSYVTVFGGIQPSILHELASGNKQTDGFVYRLLFAFMENRKPEKWANMRQEIPNHYYNQYSERLKSLASHTLPEGSPPYEYTFDKEAENIWCDWHDALKEQIHELNQTDDEEQASVLSKMSIYSTRFALILQVMYDAYTEDSENRMIKADKMQKALDLVAYFQKTSLYVLCKIAEQKEKAQDEKLHGSPSKINWNEIFGERLEMPTKDLLDVLQNKGLSKRSVERIIQLELTKIKRGFYSK